MATGKASFDRLPFSEAIEFFANKIRLPSSGWTDIWQEQHSHGFIVAGATSDSLLNDFYSALVKVRDEGGRYEDWRKHFDEITKRHGWAYNGSPGWRSRVIYDTNMTQAYNAGRWKQIQEVKHLRPYLRYVHTSVEHPRMEHLAWDGLILEVGDPWWNTHMPQNGWGCKCRVDSLSRTEAGREWEKAGKDGPDTAPPVEWEERVVGARGSNPRIVRVPKGIDPGFGYNPGKAWLEPHTVPPLTGYDAVLQERNIPWPTGFVPPPMPNGTNIPSSRILSETTPPQEAMETLLSQFGATPEKGVVFVDKTNTPVAISRALFTTGVDKEGGIFKWDDVQGKAKRLPYVNLLADTIKEPDEIWWNWERDPHKKGNWQLRRRYLKVFEIDGKDEYAITAFEWGKSGWTGSTAFMSKSSRPADAEKYFDRQRVGRLLYRNDKK